MLSVRVPWTLHVEKPLYHPTLESMQSLRFYFSFYFFVIPGPQLLCSAAHTSARWEASALQTCLCCPDGRRFPGISTCLFISVKVRVPQRTAARCWILVLFHRDTKDCYPLDRLAVTLFLLLLDPMLIDKTHFALLIIFCLSSDFTSIWFTLQSQIVSFYQLCF